MVELGLRLPGLGWLRPSGRSSALDYSAPPRGGFSPLSAPFISSVLGDAALTASVERPAGAGRHRPKRIAALPRELAVSHALTNDDSAEAYAVPAVPFRASSDTAQAGNEPGEPRDCSRLGSTVWYRYQSPLSTGLVASTGGSDHATALGVFTKVTNGWTNHGCHSDTKGASTVVFPAVAGTTYFFQITAPVRGGRLVFRLGPHASTVLASRDSLGRRATGDSEGPPKVSADGRFVVFRSWAGNFDSRCPCERAQIYLRDLATQRTELISLSVDGKPANGDGHFPSISADGRYVVWSTYANNLVPGDTNGEADVYLRDRTRGTTERVTVWPDGRQLTGHYPAISADGRYVAFQSSYERDKKAFPHSPATGPQYDMYHIYRMDRVTGRVERADVSDQGAPADHDSLGPVITSDGRYVKFWSRGSNLVNDLPPTHRVQNWWLDEYQGREYVHDFVTGKTTMECRAADGAPGNDECFGGTLSRNGRWFAFWSTATNLMGELLPPVGAHPILHLYLRDRETGVLERVTRDAAGQPCGETRPKNVSVTRIVSPFGYARVPLTAISPDGRFLVFETAADCLQNDTNGYLDVFVYDRSSPKITRISESSFGVEANRDSFHPDMSEDGRVIVYMSHAWNLVADDDNARQDVYVSMREA